MFEKQILLQWIGKEQYQGNDCYPVSTISAVAEQCAYTLKWSWTQVQTQIMFLFQKNERRLTRNKKGKILGCRQIPYNQRTDPVQKIELRSLRTMT